MRRIIGLVIIVIICASLIGCAGSPVRTHWQATRHTSGMLKLQPGMNAEEVIELMGTPEKTEMYRGKNEEAFLVYLYITEGKDSYSRRWSEANYTPVVFKDGKLDGWGWSYLNNSAKKYEFIVKDLY